MKSILKRIMQSKKTPQERLEGIMRDMNNKIPEMNRKISLLKNNIINLEKEFVSLTEEEKDLRQKKKLAQDNNRTELLQQVEDTLSLVMAGLKTDQKQLDGLKKSYHNSLESMKSYINSKNHEMRMALTLVENHDKTQWKDRCDTIIRSFEGIAGNGSGSFPLNHLNEYNSSNIAESDGYCNEFIEKKIQLGYEILERIKAVTAAIEDKKIRKKADEIVHLSELILDDMRKKPEDIHKERLFLSYYLQSVLKIIEGYVTLSSQEIRSSEGDMSLKKTEMLMDNIKKAFKKILVKLQEDEIIHLKTEIELLGNVLKGEGYMIDPIDS